VSKIGASPELGFGHQYQRGYKAMEVFISHSSLEASLANGLRDWLQDKVPNTTAFCSSVPDDLPPGDDWFQTIVEHARNADRCLILLSPDSLDKHWLYFEAGLTFGAAAIHKLIPVLYGGLVDSSLPGPLRHRQALLINDRGSFNAFVNQTLDARGGDQWFDEFKQALSPPVGRFIEYGLYGGYFGDCNIERNNNLILSAQPTLDFSRAFPRLDPKGTPRRIVALRVTAVPRRQGIINHWKFGIQLRQSNQQGVAGRVFELHSSVHEGRSTWSIYSDPNQQIAFNFPARLENERKHSLEIWLSPDLRDVTCVGLDSSGERVCFRNENGSTAWRLYDYDWDEVMIKAWGDNYPIRVDVDELEIHRARV
jgi:hypothetical protein